MVELTAEQKRRIECYLAEYRKHPAPEKDIEDRKRRVALFCEKLSRDHIPNFTWEEWTSLIRETYAYGEVRLAGAKLTNQKNFAGDSSFDHVKTNLFNVLYGWTTADEMANQYAIALKIRYLGDAFLSEILHWTDPEHFAIKNKQSIKGMTKILGESNKLQQMSYGQFLSHVRAIAEEIQQLGGWKTLADSLPILTGVDEWLEGIARGRISPPPDGNPNRNNLLPYFEKKGYKFSQFQIATFYSALKTKGFVILSGLSGTGKTKLAQHFGELFGDNRVRFVSVRPDWRDSKNLLGFVNPLLDGKYQSTGLLRFLLRARGAACAPKSSPLSLKEWIASQLETAKFQGWLAHYRDTWQRLRTKQADQMTKEDLDLLWNEKTNGIASLGQAAGMPLNAGLDELRQMTAIIQDLSKSPGQRLITAMDYFQQLPLGRLHWARVLRALAAFDPDHVTTIGNHDILRRLAERLGYDHVFRIRKLVETKNDAEIDRGFQFIRAKTDALVSSTDPLTRAIVPWLAWEFFEGEVSSELESQPSPYFLILDEMNLARVEYYFAEFLSVLESGRLRQADIEAHRESGELEPDYHAGFTRETIHLHSSESDLEDASVGENDEDATAIPNALRLPPNLYIIGTVNVDETTFAFSPKVLDRAFTIEFRDVDLENYHPSLADETEANQIAESIRADVFSDFTRDSKFIANGKEEVAIALDALGERREALVDLGKALEPFDLHFGYRVLDEIALFFANAREAQEAGIIEFDSDDAILDAAVLMKVLPKIHGSRQKLEEPLTRVLRWTLKKKIGNGRMEDVLKQIGDENTQRSDIPLLLERWDMVVTNFAYPQTAKKTFRMLHTLYATGFASFA